MKKKILLIILFVLALVFGFTINNNYKVISEYVTSKLFYSGEESVELSHGTYTSSDGHTIKIAEDGTILYDDTYTLTAALNDRGSTVSGKIGTDNKDVTFHQVNETTLISGGRVTYKHGGVNVYLHDLTVFRTNNTPTVNNDGGLDVYRGGTKVNSYATLQDAVDASNSGDVIKVVNDFTVLGGAYIDKNLTIEGNGNVFDRSKWANQVFVVKEGVTLTINDLEIDGGAVNFEIDWEKDYPAAKEGTLDNDPIVKTSAIVSSGNLNLNNVDIINHYTDTDWAGTIRIIKGNANLKDCDFLHNYGRSHGASVTVGLSFVTDQTEYLIKNVNFENCKFYENFTNSGNGGAVDVFNTEKVTFTKVEFVKCMASGYTAGGGALYFDRTDYGTPDKLDLPFVQAYFDECLFQENYSGNDGFAIQNENADLYIKNTKFIRNVGLAGGSSVGTVSSMSYRDDVYKAEFTNVVFDGNSAPSGGSIYGDHGSNIELKMENVELKNNVGSVGVLLYAGDADIKNVTVENETASTAIFDFRPYVSVEQYPDYEPPIYNLENVKFTNTNTPADILVRKHQHNTANNTGTLNIIDNVEGNVHVWDGNKVNVEGTLNGDIVTDGVTPKENIVVKENGNVTGEVVKNDGEFIVNILYVGENELAKKAYIYLGSDKTYTDKELFNMHHVGKEGYKLEYYTDNKYETLWNYQVTAATTLYAKWVEHEHSHDGTIVLYKNVIYGQCECGYFVNELSLISDEDIHFDNKEHGVEVVNTLGIEEKEYTIKYQSKDKDGNYVDMEGVPVKVGEYRAVLTYGEMVITNDYVILEAINNPNTGILTPYLICGFIFGLGALGTVLYRKKKFM